VNDENHMDDIREALESAQTLRESMRELRAARDRIRAARTARTAAKGGHNTGPRIAAIPVSKLPARLRSVELAEDGEDD